VIIRKGTENNLVQKVNMEQRVSAPINSNQTLGSVTYEIDGNVIQTIDIIADKEIKKDTISNVAMDILDKWFCLLR
jgi:hypothetical protein